MQVKPPIQPLTEKEILHRYFSVLRKKVLARMTKKELKEQMARVRKGKI